MNANQIYQSWEDGCLADFEALIQLAAIPGPESLEMVGKIGMRQKQIMDLRARARFLLFLEESLCVEAIGASLSASVIEAIMLVYDLGQIVWQPGESTFRVMGAK